MAPPEGCGRSDPAAGEGSVAEPSLGWLGEAGGGLRPLARIWATVELERALAGLGLDASRAAAALDDPLLGARVVVIPADGDGPGVALAEPSTEGRLAGRLARHDEGPAGSYLAAPVGLDAVRALAAAAQVPLSAPARGPFGWSILVLAGPIAGPSIILVEPAAVPSRP